MATGDKRIIQLGKSATTAKDGVFAIVDPITDKTVQIEVQKALGAVRANMEWQSDTTYGIGDFVLYIGVAWKSLQASNVGNIPTENTFWTEETISLADGITDTQWSAGLFTYNDSKVIYNNQQYYLQTTAPFESSDIAAEIIAGNWGAPTLAAQDHFDMTPQNTPPSHLEARFYYDNIKKNFVFFNDRLTVSGDLLRELWTRSVNKTGTTSTNGKAVYVNGATGNLPNVALAKADLESTSSAIGIYTEDVAIDDDGEVTAFGLVNDLDTSSFSAGDLLYLSESVAGGITNVKPEIPNQEVPLGWCIKSHVSTGIIWINIGHIERPIHRSIGSAWNAFSGSTAAVNYLKGYYTFNSSFTPSGTPQTLGAANIAYDGHVYFVLGASSTNMVIRVSGTSYDDTAGRTATDTEDIDTSGGVLDDYFETAKKWIGQVSITLQSGTGIIVVYGWASYWDNRNTKFVAVAFEWVGRAGANDPAPNIRLWHHKSTGWTYNAAGAIPPTAIVDMQVEYNTEFQFSNGEYFKFKKIGLSTLIDGTTDEGLIIGIDITANNAVANSNVEIQIIGS